MLTKPHIIHLAFLIALICAFPLIADLDYDPGIRAGIMPEGGFEVFLGGGHLTNSGSSEDTYHIVLDPSELPDEWSANFCAFGSCYPLEATSSLLPGRDTEISVHVFPTDDGAGTVTLTISSSRTGLTDTIMYWASMDPEIVVVNGSDLPELSLHYLNSFSNMGKIWGLLNRREIDIETFDLSDYGTLVWFTGPELDSIFDEMDTTVLRDYLTGGGNLILSSQGAGPYVYSAGMTDWMAANLKTEWITSDSSLNAFYGLASSPFEGISGSFLFEFEEYGEPSIISPIDGAEAIVAYDAVESPTAAIGHYQETGSKIVHFAFPLEAINPSEVRDSIIAKSLAYIDGAGFIYENPKLPKNQSLTVFPNPFNSSVNISINGDVSSEAEIQIFDITGSIVTTIPLNLNKTAVWNAKNSNGEPVPAGIYFVKTDSENSPIVKVLYVK